MNQSWTRYLPDIIQEWLDGRHQLQKTIGNTGWLLFDRILRMGLGLVISAWVARFLGPAQLGELAYVISFLAFFQVVAGLEASGFIVRDIARDEGEASVILGSAIWLRIVAGAVSWVLAILFMYLFHPEDQQLITLTAIVGATMVFQASDTVDLWFQSQSQSKRTVIAKLVAFLFSNGVKVVLLLVKAPLVAFAGVICLEAAASALGLALAYRRFSIADRWRASLSQAKALLNSCWPFIASGLMMTTFARIDQIMLKEMLGEQALGIYAAALPISLAWSIIPTTLVTSIAPFVARKMKQDEAAYQEMLVKIFRFFAIVAILAASLTSLASPWIIGILYGSQYQASALILSAHVFVNVFLFQGTAQYLWVINNNNARTVVLTGTFLSAIICIASNAILIKKFGIMGAPFSTLLTECASVVIIPCLMRRDLFDLYLRAFIPFMSYRKP
jgi:O-antigen/teichoic acid export membrane protein